MKKMITILASALCILTLLSACTAKPSGAATQYDESSVTQTGEAQAQISDDAVSASSETQTKSGNTKGNITVNKKAICEQARKLLSDQGTWSNSFLGVLDIDSIYKRYVDDGGDEEDAAAFAEYITDNASAPVNWKELFENDLMSAYSKTPDHYEDLGDGIFQVYVEIDGKVVPFVTVNSRTGGYHG